MKYTNLDGSPIGAMSSLEFLSTAFTIAGLVWIFLLYQPTAHSPVITPATMCPDIVIEIRHGVRADLRTFIHKRAIDGCANNLNVN
jgi:hypothetical protein